MSIRVPSVPGEKKNHISLSLGECCHDQISYLYFHVYIFKWNNLATRRPQIQAKDLRDPGVPRWSVKRCHRKYGLCRVATCHMWWTPQELIPLCSQGDQEEIDAWPASGLGGAAFMCLVLYPQLVSLFSHHSILLDEETGGSTMVKSTADLHLSKFFLWTVCGGGGDTDSSSGENAVKVCLFAREVKTYLLVGSAICYKRESKRKLPKWGERYMGSKMLKCKAFMLEKEDRCSRNWRRGRRHEGDMSKLSMSAKIVRAWSLSER